MEKIDRVLVLCQNCLRTKVTKKIESDPERTRIAYTESCDKCCVESSGIIRYFDSEMDEIIPQ